MFKSFHPASQIWLPINRINLRFIPLNFIERIYCFKVVSLQKRSCVVIYNTLKFIESFKVISLFSYQGSLFCCRSRRQLIYYILSSLFCQELFSFLKVFLSIGFVRSVISNVTTLIVYHVLFCLSRIFCFILEIFPKSCCPLSNHVLSSGQLDYNTTRILFCQPFFNTFSLASEQQRLNFTLL